MKDKGLSGRLVKLFKGKRATTILLVAGLVGIALIFLSDRMPALEKSNESETFSTAEYSEYLEKKLESIVCKINGAGKCEVAVTIGISAEYIYAYDKSSESRDEEAAEGYTREGSDEKKYTIIENKDGGQEPVTVAVIPPTVSGVLIVSEGADNELVRGEIIDAVAAALDISESRICVTKRKQ